MPSERELIQEMINRLNMLDSGKLSPWFKSWKERAEAALKPQSEAPDGP